MQKTIKFMEVKLGKYETGGTHDGETEIDSEN